MKFINHNLLSLLSSINDSVSDLLLKMELEKTANLDDLKQENGTNKRNVVCSFCPSVILLAGDGHFSPTKFPLPTMTRQKGVEEIAEDDLTDFWKVENMYDFQNVGFSNTVDRGGGLKKYLIGQTVIWARSATLIPIPNAAS